MLHALFRQIGPHTPLLLTQGWGGAVIVVQKFLHLARVPQCPNSPPPAPQVGGFDLIWDGGPVLRFDKPTSLPSMLGAYNERDKNQLRSFKVRSEVDDDRQ